MAANLNIADHPPICDSIIHEAPDTPPSGTVSVWLVAGSQRGTCLHMEYCAQ